MVNRNGNKQNISGVNGIIFLLLVIVSVMLCGCDANKMQDAFELVKFYCSNVTFPVEVLKIENGTVSLAKFECPQKPFVVSYHSGSECTDCALSHLYEEYAIDSIGKESELFELFLFFSPPPEEQSSFIEKVVSYSPRIPIYIDFNNVFESENCIPKSKNMHVFLTDSGGNVLMVGSPDKNQNIKNLYISELIEYE